ncbi:MAG TPA: hypothetical protein PLX77_03040, partial [Candidatus Cloacimonadota bacterium]|nr:hypothetical protein [Candidatus Cloacimonadota bacterium]
KNGKNVMTLSARISGEYDAEGNLVFAQKQKGNKTYMGYVRKNISSDPPTIETLEYNHMNQIGIRKLESIDPKTGDSTLIEYNAKGKILAKTSIRHHQNSLWTMEYNQVGYISRYYQSVMDSTNRISERLVYDYADELKELHTYLYDSSDLLTAIVAFNPEYEVIGITEYIYDERGNCIEEKHYKDEDTITNSIQYQYDAKNRMIQRSEYRWNPRFGTFPQLQKMYEYSYK